MSSHPFKPPADRQRRKEWARVAGKARGRQLRRNAHGRQVGHKRDQALALAVAYPVQLADEAEVRRLFAKLQDGRGVNFSERGFQTRWELYKTLSRCYRAKGQDFKTTNGQRARALDLAGRQRCERTVQRAHRDLAAMGLVRVMHVKRGRARAGRRDCLRVFLTQSFVTPPTAAPAAPASPSLNAGASPASPSSFRAERPSVAPPDGGRDQTPAEKPAGDPENGPPEGGEVADQDAARPANGGDNGSGASGDPPSPEQLALREQLRRPGGSRELLEQLRASRRERPG